METTFGRLSPILHGDWDTGDAKFASLQYPIDNRPNPLWRGWRLVRGRDDH